MTGGRTREMLRQAIAAAETGSSVLVVAASEADARRIDALALRIVETMLPATEAETLWARIIVAPMQNLLKGYGAGGLYDRYFVDHAAEEAREEEWRRALDSTLRHVAVGRPACS